MNTRKKFFTARMVRYWNRLPRFEDAGSVHGQVGWGFEKPGLVSLPMEGGLD